MEYERIHKVQTGIISPTKLRMKLMGPHHQKKKDGSNSNSSRTSPSKLGDSEFVKNSLLGSDGDLLDEEVPSLDVSSVRLPTEVVSDSAHGDEASCRPKESLPKGNGDVGHTKMHHFPRAESCNLSTIHPVRNFEDENLDYDSNASSSSFEFHKAERSLQNAVARSISRPMSSKWNNAEKWIMNRHHSQGNCSKKTGVQGQGSRFPVTNTVRVVPDCNVNDNRLPVSRTAETKRVDYCQPAPQFGMEKFSFVPPAMHPLLNQIGTTASTELCPQMIDLKEVGHTNTPCAEAPSEDSTAFPAIRSVAMRDMGTEMTPIPSQEPSRTATPVGATTPLRSPSSSLPSTPRRRGSSTTPMEHATDGDPQYLIEDSRRELSEHELKQKTRKEIVALGVQLGKMNIAAWASKDDQEKRASEASNLEELHRIENEKRAAAWEEAEKSKHLARYKREEIKIQAWESQKKAKLDAEIKRVEAQVEQLRAQAHAKMLKKVVLVRQKSEQKRVVAVSRRDQQAEKTSAQAEYIRQTGRIPPSNFICCGWF